MMKQLMGSIWIAGFLLLTASAAPANKPNVLFIAIDDLNDWVGFMGGHPQAITPNMDRLAKNGTAFLNAYCQAPLCNPSRTSMLTGLRPDTTGIYALNPSFREIPELADIVTLPQYFSAHGYTTYAVGKLFHQNEIYAKNPPAVYKNEFDVLGPILNRAALLPEKKLVETPCPWAVVDWGTFPHADSDRCDYQCASWAIEQLKSSRIGEKPFFLGAGFCLPHLPCITPPEWFNLYPEDVQLPPILPGDRNDTPRASWYLHWALPEPRLAWMEEHHQMRNFVRSYLASVSFADAQVGRLLDALEASPYATNTLVVLWSDHGYHLGEKEITGKNTLWDEATRVPLIFAGPGVPKGQLVNSPAELIDIYPTLIDLAGLPEKSSLDGLSLLPQIKNPAAVRERPAVTTAGGPGNSAVRDERFRYIHYADGSEEFYDMLKDPNAWTNSIANPEYAAEQKRLEKWLPTKYADPVPHSNQRLSEFRNGVFYWDGHPCPADAPIPGIETNELWQLD